MNAPQRQPKQAKVTAPLGKRSHNVMTGFDSPTVQALQACAGAHVEFRSVQCRGREVRVLVMCSSAQSNGIDTGGQCLKRTRPHRRCLAARGRLLRRRGLPSGTPFPSMIPGVVLSLQPRRVAPKSGAAVAGTRNQYHCWTAQLGLPLRHHTSAPHIVHHHCPQMVGPRPRGPFPAAICCDCVGRTWEGGPLLVIGCHVATSIRKNGESAARTTGLGGHGTYPFW